MQRSDLRSASLNELIAEFAASAVRKALLVDDAEHENEDDIAAVNREIRWGWEVRDEIARRGTEATLQLMDLFSYQNMQVRLYAAMATRDVAPGKSREMIQYIADCVHPPQSAAAGLHLLSKDKKFPWQQR